jgi:flagellar motility protein MotE (MotC chaperone)
MKKIMVVLQVFVLLLFVAKITALGEILQNPNAANPSTGQEKRPITEAPANGLLPSVTDVTNDDLKKPRDILTALEKKKKELDQRELLLKTDEQRITTLKKEILEKIDLLRAEQEKLNAIIEVSKTEDNKKYKDMAKVFDATPPAKAGAMLEQLDVKTAAGITMNMKKDKAGILWGYLSPHKAIEITREITRSTKQ